MSKLEWQLSHMHYNVAPSLAIHTGQKYNYPTLMPSVISYSMEKLIVKLKEATE